MVRQAASGMQKVTLMICCSLEQLFMWVYPLWSVYEKEIAQLESAADKSHAKIMGPDLLRRFVKKKR